MEPLIEKLITTGGPSGVLIVCVWIFLKHLREESALNRELFKEIHEDHVSARQEAHVIIKENATAMREFAVVMRNGPFQRTT